MGRAFAWAVSLLPCAAPADVLTYAIWPNPNPAHGIACRIELLHGQIIAVEVLGTGMPPELSAVPCWMKRQRPCRRALLRARRAAVSSGSGCRVLGGSAEPDLRLPLK